MSFFFESPGGESTKKLSRAHAVSFLVAMGILSLFVFLAFSTISYNWKWDSVFEYKHKFFQGWVVSLWISLATLVLSLLIGLLAAICKKSTFLPLRYLVSIYVEIIRGTPLLVQIYFLYYIFAVSIGLQNRYLAGILIMSLFSGAYIAEIFRAGINSVGKSQIQSAKAIGLTTIQTYRFVILPQALRHSLPALAGQFANLIKDSSLLSTIAINEFTLNAQEVNAITYSSYESYFPLAIGYLAITIPVMQFSRIVESRIRYET